MKLIGALPLPYRMAGVLIVMGAVLYSAYYHGKTVSDVAWQLKWDTALAEQASAEAQAQAQARAEEQRRVHSNQLVATHALNSQNLADADAAGAVADVGSVQHAATNFAAHAGGCSAHPAVTDPSTPARHAAMVLSDLLTRADQRAAQLAAYADRSRIAGQACEAAYEGLSAGLN